MNGAVEAANKNIKKILRKMIDNYRAIIPAEVEIPSLRIIQEAELSDVDLVRKRIDQLTLIDEKRKVAVCHGQLYRQRMIRTLHKKVRARILEIGQLVRKVLSGGALVLSEMDDTKWPKPINSDVVKRYYV
ncbi:uncharacterized protein [Solanum tuberosum]|uniref:uncharacterized protein n=1 Tax=Solanum tuberosum TaxID=4113 RepID=UPI00073A3E9B|nr:PREDICTED: uncharacterized protein LOC107063324 [Solanum tuberosum]